MAQPGRGAGGQQAGPVRPWAIPEKFDASKTSDWTSWQFHFEQTARVNGWTPAEQVNFLPLYLTVAAQIFYHGLPPATRTGPLPALLLALQTRFAPAANVELHRAELLARRQHPDESLSDFCEGIRKLARLAYPALQADVQDVLAKDQFIAGLTRRDIRLKVRRATPATIDAALTHALQAHAILETEMCVSPQPAEEAIVCATSTPDVSVILRSIMNRLSKMEVSLAASVDTLPKCYGCGSPEHFVAYCPNRPATAARGRGGGRGFGRQGNGRQLR